MKQEQRMPHSKEQAKKNVFAQWKVPKVINFMRNATERCQPLDVAAACVFVICVLHVVCMCCTLCVAHVATELLMPVDPFAILISLLLIIALIFY